MNKWHRCYLHYQNIEHVIKTATLIKMPNNSEYAGYVFWHPSKLVRKEDNNIMFLFNETFSFSLKKYGKGKYNKRNIISGKNVTSEDMLEQWPSSDVNRKVVAKKSFLKVDEPQKINYEYIKVDECLKNNN